MKIRLPTGGTLVAPTDPTTDPPSDCSRAFGLLPLVSSYLAGTQCVVKLLELVGPLTDIVKALDGTPELEGSAAKFLKAADALAPCKLAITGAGAAPFVRDLLCVVRQAVRCILGELKSVVAVLTSLASQLQAARAGGNAELVRALETAQQNAQTRASNILPSIEAVQSVLDLAGTFFEVAGIAPVKMPAAPRNADLDSLNPLAASLASAAASLEIAVDALGGCDA